jgi:fibrillarin-like pre-rRNA processing protein
VEKGSAAGAEAALVTGEAAVAMAATIAAASSGAIAAAKALAAAAVMEEEAAKGEADSTATTGATTAPGKAAPMPADTAARGVKATPAAAAVLAPDTVAAVAATGAEEGTAATSARAVATLAALTMAAAAKATRERTENALENDAIRWISVAGEKHIATLNLVPGDNVYGEKLVKHDGEEYRLWDPFRSKLAGSLKKGLKKMPIQNGTKVLYLGASTGTTVSHVSDIVGNSGIVFAVEPATRVARDLIENVASKRKNVVPVLEDARRPQSYFSVFGKVDVVYCDIAQPDQTEIAIANCNAYLKLGGVMLLLVKTQSIDVTRDPNAVIAQEAKKLEKAGFTIEQILKLEPFDKDHGMIYCFK